MTFGFFFPPSTKLITNWPLLAWMTTPFLPLMAMVPPALGEPAPLSAENRISPASAVMLNIPPALTFETMPNPAVSAKGPFTVRSPLAVKP